MSGSPGSNQEESMRTTDTSVDLHALADAHYVWPLLDRADLDAEPPLIVTDGSEARLRDIDGNEFIDLMSTPTRAQALGYSRPEMVEAMHRQLERLPYAGTAWQVADVTIELAAKLAELTPGDLVATAFSGSGSEANETAFKIVRAHHHAGSDKPRAYKVISRWNAYHGATGTAMACSDLLDVRHPAEPGVPGVSHIPAPTCYRCPFGLEYPSCGVKCAEYLEQEIQHQGPELVGAFIAEPVMQANGVQIPPPEYLPRVQEICRQYDVMFIVDEVITGFGRTGAWFASNHWNLEPDVITLAKALTAGYAPLGATVISEKLKASLSRLADVHTFGGHATSCAAASEAIRIYADEQLPERAKALGAELLERLKELERFEIVGQVRGIGLWLAVDFTEDRATRAPLPREAMGAIMMGARREGVITSRNGTAIEMAPPLTIDRDEAFEGIARFERAVETANRELSPTTNRGPR
jgi:putrescine aminotransferase